MTNSEIAAYATRMIKILVVDSLMNSGMLREKDDGQSQFDFNCKLMPVKLETSINLQVANAMLDSIQNRS